MMTGLARIAAALCAIVATGVASAAQRTFVSTQGADSNPCTVTQQCRSFATAIAQTSSGGELIVLDSGGYGPVTIDKSVALIAATSIAPW